MSHDGIGVTSWGHPRLDIFARSVSAFLVLRWVAANEGIVDEHGSGTWIAGTAPSDD